ncbi:hypothetical protein DLAC_10863 [Tieghemostelium lacteum]|uniref:EGF-like domain-containing protein n=1 Tax=Tieghemostelium lacteum TaxID=361077 RepID=A0A151Z413_TIELA|nr:hypothetical protein DLAC_10863 [Tieghemostelium lacteum]|eukprot:KYQ88681.1 hypothetical protein DLAC_10863 [Tieghemostelium lacteum]
MKLIAILLILLTLVTVNLGGNININNNIKTSSNSHHTHYNNINKRGNNYGDNNKNRKLNNPIIIHDDIKDNDDDDDDDDEIDSHVYKPTTLYEQLSKKVESIKMSEELNKAFNNFNQLVYNIKMLNSDKRVKSNLRTLGNSPITEGLESWSLSLKRPISTTPMITKRVIQYKPINDNEILSETGASSSSSNSNSFDNSQSSGTDSSSSSSSSGDVVIISNSTCALGNLMFSDDNVDTCQGEGNCYINEMICNGVLITLENNNKVLLNSTYPYDECQLVSMYCPHSSQPLTIFNFKEQWGYQDCYIYTLTCNDNYLNDCILSQVVCDSFTVFNKDYFGFTCSTNRLVCNGKIIPRNQYQNYSNEISNGQCLVKNSRCSGKNDECLSMNINCDDEGVNCQLKVNSDTTCIGQCFGQRNVSSCECPDDFTGRNCAELTPFKCDIVFNSPKPQCTGSRDLILTSQDCFSFSLSDQTNFNMNLNCYFDPPVKSSSQSQFAYWIDTPNFKVSQQDNWIFAMEILNLNRLYNNSLVNTLVLEKDQIIGQKSIWNNRTLSDIPSEYWIAKRVYNEIFLGTKYQNKTITRYFIKATDYPSNEPAQASSKKKTILIVFGVIAILM